MTDKIIVIHSDGKIELFKPRLIGQAIMKETGVSEKLAMKIQKRIANKFYKLKEDGLNEVSTSQIRAEVSSQLLKEREFEAEEQTRKLGMSVGEFEDLLNNGCKDNANIGYSPEMIAKYAYDSIAKEYALLKMPEECAEAYKAGLMHIHDMEYYMTRPNCLSGNNKIIIKDGQGVVSYIRLDDFVEKWQSNMEDYYVPSFNYDSCVMEWNKVENAYKSSDKEQVYSVKFNKGYRIECTSDHKFIKSHNNKPCKDYDIKVSEFDHYKDLRLINLTDIHYYNSDNDYYKSALFGLFLGDGNISKNGAVKFSFSKTDKAEYCDSLLKKIGLEYSYNVYNDDNYQNGLRHDFYIIDRIYPNKNKSQLICHFKNQLNLKGVFEGLVNSDGCVILDKNNIIRCNFTSTNKDIFDLYHLCLISLGLRGSISIHKPTNDNHNVSYNSSTFGSGLLKLFDEITLRDTFQEYHNQANKKCKQYQEISEITPKSIEYIGEMPVYNLTIENNHNYLAGVDGFILTQNCMNYDLRFFARNGLKIDGKGLMGSVSKPAKSLEVLLNHMLQAWMAGATVFSGGQGYVNFNTLLSPFCRGRSYKDIKQAIQGFIFNCNESLICRGGQVLFSSIALDLSCPDVLKDEPAISFEGIAVGTYKDYQEEADLIFKAVCEVSNEKDGQGAYHRFPNILFNIRRGDLDEYKGTCKILHETGANNPTIYYNNCIDLERSTMGCFSGDTELWCKIDNKLTFLSFKELSELLNADYGVTQIDKKIEVLTINDDKEIIWHKAKNFIKNKNVSLYKVDLPSRKSFICDENHDMLTFKGLNRKNILECTNRTNLIDVNCSNINVNINCDPLGVLYGFWLGDGDKTLKRGLITVQKTDKINYIENLFKELNVEYKLSKSERPDYGVDYVENKYWFDKDIFNNIDLTDLNILSGILAGCLSSDGYIRINGEFNKALTSEWVTTTKEHSDLFKWCCFNLGITYSSRWINNGKQKPFERIYIKCNESSVHLLKQLKLRDCQAKIVDSVDAEEYHQIKSTKGTRIKNIQTFGKGDSYCLDVNDRIIIGSDFILTANCRSSLPMNYTGVYEKDCVNTGNFMYNTINLPLLALEAGGDIEKFYKKLDEICEICYTSLIHRRNTVIDAVYNKHMSDFLLQKDKETGEPLWDIDRTTITLGYCGLNECLQVLYGEGGVVEYEDEGVEIIEFINKKKQEFYERDGLRWSVIASPAESTSFKFGEINRAKYPNCPVRGKEGAYYLTNSHHIPVDSGVDWVRHIQNAGKFSQLSLGGAILHIWSSEVWSDAEAIWKLNKKILSLGNPIFWAFSKVFTYCTECGFTINGKIDVCPICQSKNLRHFDRITGYYLCVDTFNHGKHQEFEDRYRHKITEKKID